MKVKLGIFFVLLLICSNLFAQDITLEGYAGIPWGSSISQTKEKLINLVELTSDEDIKTQETLFQQNNSTNVRVLRFFKNKLYWGRTIYTDPDTTTVTAILEKLKEIYGSFDDSGKGSKPGSDYNWISKVYSKNLDIEVTINTYYDDFGRINSTTMFITYSNPVMFNEVQNLTNEQKKKEIEL